MTGGVKLGSISPFPHHVEAALRMQRDEGIEPNFTPKLGLASPIPQPTVQIPRSENRTDGGLLGGGVKPDTTTATIAPRKRAYRYAVIDHGGTGTKAIGDSPFILDWKYLGRTYTWNIVGGPRLESSGFITGRYLDKGWLVDGEYVTDDEAAA